MTTSSDLAEGDAVQGDTKLALSRDDVRSILLDWRSFDWQVQGFGMLRTYLDGPTEPRLQVWDQRLATWSNNAIHDHPWAFTSTIFAGTIYNQRYSVTEEARVQITPNGHVTEIIPGTRGGQLSERPVRPCRITLDPVEVYSMGDSYSQTHREMHLTRYLQGTVTLIERYGREEADMARVAWFGAAQDQPPFVNPYAASPDVTEKVITDALETWWMCVDRAPTVRVLSSANGGNEPRTIRPVDSASRTADTPTDTAQRRTP